MPTEYLALLFTTGFYLVAWLPASVAKKQSYGMKWLAGNRGPARRELVEWGQRAERAHQNLKDYFPGFVVAILMLGALDRFHSMTAILAWSFFALRLLHMGVYIAGRPLWRASVWSLSMLCLFALLALCFKA